ncbi:MAG TPA: hypothetical protein VGD94_15760 [Vicinamibacterales bacterium]
MTRVDEAVARLRRVPSGGTAFVLVACDGRQQFLTLTTPEVSTDVTAATRMEKIMRREVTLCWTFAVMAALTAFQVNARATQDPSTPQPQPQKVDLDELEDKPESYLGKTVTVEGEVDRVLGPHLFTIDERNWADAERELPVVVPEPFAAIVRTDAPVVVTGVVQKVPIAKIQQTLNILSSDPKIKAEIETRPVLVAQEVVAAGQAGVSLRVRAGESGTSGTGAPGATGTSGTGRSAHTVTDPAEAARATDTSLVGRRVDLKGAVTTKVTDEGFWINLPGGERIFVLTGKKSGAREGGQASVQGVILEMPEGLRVKLDAPNEPIYIFADRVTAQ